MFPTLANSPTDLTTALQQSKVQSSNSNQGKSFLTFSGTRGGWTFGRDREDVSGEQIIVNTYSFQHGWALWVAKQVTKKMVPFTEELPPPMDPVQGNHASEARAFEARFADDSDTIVVFEASSMGARNGCDTLLNEIKAKAGRGETRYLFPVVELGETSYESQHGNKIFNPVFTIVDWVDQDGTPESAAKQLEQQTETPEDEPAAPTRRRKRS